jgi:hypothetical protein
MRWAIIAHVALMFEGATAATWVYNDTIMLSTGLNNWVAALQHPTQHDIMYAISMPTYSVPRLYAPVLAKINLTAFTVVASTPYAGVGFGTTQPFGHGFPADGGAMYWAQRSRGMPPVIVRVDCETLAQTLAPADVAAALVGSQSPSLPFLVVDGASMLGFGNGQVSRYMCLGTKWVLLAQSALLPNTTLFYGGARDPGSGAVYILTGNSSTNTVYINALVEEEGSPRTLRLANATLISYVSAGQTGTMPAAIVGFRGAAAYIFVVGSFGEMLRVPCPLDGSRPARGPYSYGDPSWVLVPPVTLLSTTADLVFASGPTNTRSGFTPTAGPVLVNTTTLVATAACVSQYGAMAGVGVLPSHPGEAWMLRGGDPAGGLQHVGFYPAKYSSDCPILRTVNFDAGSSFAPITMFVLDPQSRVLYSSCGGGRRVAQSNDGDLLSPMLCATPLSSSSGQEAPRTLAWVQLWPSLTVQRDTRDPSTVTLRAVAIDPARQSAIVMSTYLRMAGNICRFFLFEVSLAPSATNLSMAVVQRAGYRASGDDFDPRALVLDASREMVYMAAQNLVDSSVYVLPVSNLSVVLRVVPIYGVKFVAAAFMDARSLDAYCFGADMAWSHAYPAALARLPLNDSSARSTSVAFPIAGHSVGLSGAAVLLPGKADVAVLAASSDPSKNAPGLIATASIGGTGFAPLTAVALNATGATNITAAGGPANAGAVPWTVVGAAIPTAGPAAGVLLVGLTVGFPTARAQPSVLFVAAYDPATGALAAVATLPPAPITVEPAVMTLDTSGDGSSCILVGAVNVAVVYRYCVGDPFPSVGPSTTSSATPTASTTATSTSTSSMTGSPTHTSTRTRTPSRSPSSSSSPSASPQPPPAGVHGPTTAAVIGASVGGGGGGVIAFLALVFMCARRRRRALAEDAERKPLVVNPASNADGTGAVELGNLPSAGDHPPTRGDGALRYGSGRAARRGPRPSHVPAHAGGVSSFYASDLDDLLKPLVDRLGRSSADGHGAAPALDARAGYELRGSICLTWCAAQFNVQPLSSTAGAELAALTPTAAHMLSTAMGKVRSRNTCSGAAALPLTAMVAGGAAAAVGVRVLVAGASSGVAGMAALLCAGLCIQAAGLFGVRYHLRSVASQYKLQLISALDAVNTTLLLAGSPQRAAVVRFGQLPAHSGNGAALVLPPLFLDVYTVRGEVPFDYALVRELNSAEVLRCPHRLQLPLLWLYVGLGGLLLAALGDCVLAAVGSSGWLPASVVELARLTTSLRTQVEARLAAQVPAPTAPLLPVVSRSLLPLVEEPGVLEGQQPSRAVSPPPDTSVSRQGTNARGRQQSTGCVDEAGVAGSSTTRIVGRPTSCVVVVTCMTAATADASAGAPTASTGTGGAV